MAVKHKKPAPTLKSRQELFAKLPAQGRQVITTRAAKAVLPYSEWMKVLKALDVLDRECEAGRSAANKIGYYLIIPVLVFGALTFVIPLFAVLAGVSLIAMIAYFVRASKFAKYDTDNRLRLFLLPLLALLKGDIPKGAQVSIALNMNRIDTAPYKTGENPAPRRGNTIGGKEHHYRQEWLVMDLRLSDGTGLQIKMEDAVRVRKLKKRSISGKIKYKTKKKVKRTFRVATKFKTEVYQGKPGQKLTEATDKYLVVKSKVTRLIQKVEEIPDRNVVLGGISHAYSQVLPKK